MIGHQPAADHPERRIGPAVRLDPPAGTNPAAIRVQQKSPTSSPAHTAGGPNTHPDDDANRSCPTRQPHRAQRTRDAPPQANRAYSPPTRTTDRAPDTHKLVPRPAPTTPPSAATSVIIDHLLTQAPAAAFSRKSPAQEALLPVAPDRTHPPGRSTFPGARARHPDYATASYTSRFSARLGKSSTTGAGRGDRCGSSQLPRFMRWPSTVEIAPDIRARAEPGQRRGLGSPPRAVYDDLGVPSA